MQDEIEVAVEWWVQRLADADPHADTGDIGNDMFLSSHRARFQEAVSVEDLERFKAALRAVLAEDTTGSSPAILVKTDYEAQDRLLEACQRAGLSAKQYDYRLPTKTVMWVEPGSVTVAAGYGAPFQEIFKR